MKIVVTSRSFSKNETLKQELDKSFSEVKYNSEGLSLAGQELIDFVGDSDGWIVGLEQVDASVLKSCTSVKVVSKYGVGLDNINLEDCKQVGVKIGWKGGVNKLSVAEMALGFMIGLSRNLYSSTFQHKSGLWNKDGGAQLTGKKVGIIGYGHIGQEVSRMLVPFKCSILANDIINIDHLCNHRVRFAEKQEIFETCDVITIHTPLTDKTLGIINEKVLKIMKPNAIFINTARGPLVVQNDLKVALKNSQIHGAAIDVYEEEPPGDLEFLNLENLVCTPHIGGNSKEAVLAMGMSAITELRSQIANS